MADPYTTLGIARSASEKEIKSAYRKLAKELHPDTNKDNPKATERFSEVTRAYDLLSDKDKRARFDRGEIDADGNPAMPFGMGGGGFRSGPGPGAQGRGYSAEDIHGFGNGGPDLGDIFEGLFGGRAAAGGAGFGGARSSAGFGGGARRPPQRGANVHYRLKVPFVDAATGKDQRITLADGKTIDLKLPAGVEDGTQMRLKGKGENGPGGAGDALVTIEIGPHPFFRREGARCADRSADHARRGGQWRKGQGPHGRRRGDAHGCAGQQHRQGAPPQGQGLPHQGRHQGRSAGDAGGRSARR